MTIDDASVLRTPLLQRFVDAVGEAVAAQDLPAGAAAGVARSVFDALKHPAPAAAAVASRVPACVHLQGALGAAQAGPQSVARVGKAFAAIETMLPWKRRANTESLGPHFAASHGNAVIIGAGGLEPRTDVMVGASLMAPRLQYPDHRHPPEEIYFVLSKGSWRQQDRPWHEPGPGGIVFNPSNIVHAMLSGEEPLLAIWCLWTRDNPYP